MANAVQFPHRVSSRKLTAIAIRISTAFVGLVLILWTSLVLFPPTATRTTRNIVRSQPTQAPTVYPPGHPPAIPDEDEEERKKRHQSTSNDCTYCLVMQESFNCSTAACDICEICSSCDASVCDACGACDIGSCTTARKSPSEHRKGIGWQFLFSSLPLGVPVLIFAVWRRRLGKKRSP